MENKIHAIYQDTMTLSEGSPVSRLAPPSALHQSLLHSLLSARSPLRAVAFAHHPLLKCSGFKTSHNCSPLPLVAVQMLFANLPLPLIALYCILCFSFSQRYLYLK